jgi:hypothetical protein
LQMRMRSMRIAMRSRNPYKSKSKKTNTIKKTVKIIKLLPKRLNTLSSSNS